MNNVVMTHPLRHFVKHLFLMGNVYVERKKAKEDVDAHIQRMRKSIIRMRLTYTDIDKFREKIDNLLNWERKYAKFFKPEDLETQELKKQIVHLKRELRSEKEEKYMIINENDEKIRQLTESLHNIKNQMRYLYLEKAKRQQRQRALEQKIMHKVDMNNYYNS